MKTWKRRTEGALRGVGIAILIVLMGAFSLWVAAVGEVSYQEGTIVDVECADGRYWIRIEMDDATLKRCRITADSAAIVEVGDRVEIRTRRTMWGSLPYQIRLLKLSGPAA